MKKRAPNQRLDLLIAELAELLEPSQLLVNNRFEKPQGPVVAIVGCSRSGTTFVTQILAQTGVFSYPSNLMNRFAYAPYIGSLIQKMLLDSEYDFNGELSDLNSNLQFKSELGKTKGALGINEFFPFWRRFFPNHDPRFLDDQELAVVQVAQLRKELASVESAFGRPFMAKGKMLQYNIDFFAREMPELVFLHVRRDPVLVMQSLVEARIKSHGCDRLWFGNKPSEYALLKDRPVEEQVAGQIFFTEQAIQQAAKTLNPDNYLMINYEDVCKEPAAFIRDLADHLKLPELAVDFSHLQPTVVQGNQPRLDITQLRKFDECYKKLAKNGSCNL